MNTQERLPLWSALSFLFLDTEISADTHRYIARQVISSGLSPEAVLEVLWFEVFPALCDNLRDVTGEWAGFDDAWLCERICAVVDKKVKAYGPVGMLSVHQVIDIIETEWTYCCRYLPAAYSIAVRPPNKRIKRQGAAKGLCFWFF